MVQIIRKELPFGRLAENLGRNVGESMGEEAGRQITSRGVGQLAKRLKEKGVTNRLDLLTELDRVPGMTPDMRETYLPALEDALRGESVESDQVSQESPGVSGVSDVSAVQEVATPEGVEVSEEDSATILTPEEQSSLLQRPSAMTPQEIAQRGLQLRKQSPGLYPTTAASEEGARQEEEAANRKLAGIQNVATAKTNLTEQVRTEFDRRLNNKLQTANLADAWKQFPGTMQDAVRNAAIANVKRGETAATAAEKAAKNSLGLVRKMQDFTELPGRSWLGRGSSENVRELSQYQKDFDKLDVLPEFKALLQQKGFGDHMASAIAYPGSTGILKALGKLQGLAKVATKERNAAFDLAKLEGLLTGQDRTLLERKDELLDSFVNDISSQLKEEDSFQTIALALNDVGIDERSFYEKMRAIADDLNLSDRQEQELQQGLPVVPSQEDLFFLALKPFGVSKGKFGGWEAVMRAFGGKR